MSQVVGSRGKYEYITEYDSYNYNGTATVDAYVIHHWGVDGQVFENVINGLIVSDQASAHYVLEDGRVACIIPPKLRAWHVESNYYQQVMPGIYDINSHTIGIECRPECTEGDVETLCQLLAELFCDYGVKPIYGHKEFMATKCPGRYQSQLEVIWQRAYDIYKGIMDGTDGKDDDEMKWEEFEKSKEYKLLKRLTQAQDADKPSDWAEKEWQAAIDAGITDGSRPQAAMTRQEGVAMLLRSK